MRTKSLQPLNDQNPFPSSRRSVLLLQTSEPGFQTTHPTLDKKRKVWSTTGKRSRVLRVEEVSRVYKTASEAAEAEDEVEGVEEEVERSRFLFSPGCINTFLHSSCYYHPPPSHILVCSARAILGSRIVSREGELLRCLSPCSKLTIPLKLFHSSDLERLKPLLPFVSRHE